MKTSNKYILSKGAVFLLVLTLYIVLVPQVFAEPGIGFTSPTPPNATITANTTVLFNVSINESNLAEFKWVWNNTNYTMYNDSLVLMMNFDNVSAIGENDTYAVDVSKYQNNGTISGAIWNSSGKYGGAYSFNGNNNIYINVTNSASLNFTNFTVSAWIKANSWRTNYYEGSIVNKDTIGVAGFFLRAGSGGKLSFGIGNTSGIWPEIISSALMSTGTWYHVVGVYNGTTISTYINGTLINSSSARGYATTTSNVYIGNGYDFTRTFNGSIDEVRIWNRSLSAAEVYQQYVSNVNKFNSNQWLLYVNQSLNATNTLPNGNYTYQAFATDNTGNSNSTALHYVIIDATTPVWYNNKTNLTASTLFGQIVYFNITANDTNPAQYIFSWYNGTNWINDTPVNYVSGQEIEVNKTINGTPISWTWYFNDTGGNLNQTTVWTTNLGSSIGLSQIYPTTDINITQYYLFNVTVNVSCTGSFNCGEINVSLDPTSTIVYNFTTCNQTGKSGPTHTNCTRVYNGTTLQGLVNVTEGYQKWVVPTTGTYTIEANGAGGGLVSCSGYYRGFGARVSGNFSLTAGDILFIVVGQRGSDKACSDWGAGGGGFTTIAKNVTNSSYQMGAVFPGAYVTPIVVAAGGAGTGDDGGNSGNPNATSFTPGTGLGGFSEGDSGGGAGFLGNGSDGLCGSTGAKSFLNGSNGSTCSYWGGFGGGGSPFNSGGGSGGYTGGNGTSSVKAGKAGTSYNSGSNPVNTAAANNGSGYVTITYVSQPKSGLVSTNSSAVPYWTNTSNPYQVNLTSGQSQIITWWVNATGAVNTTHTFFVYANRTISPTNANQTTTWNVTIIPLDIDKPVLWNTKTNLTKITMLGETVYFNITANDTNPAQYIFSFYNGTDWVNDTAKDYVSGREIEVNKTITGSPISWIWYFNDTYGNRNQSSTETTTLQSIIGLSLVYPTTNIDITQYYLFNVTVNVSCVGPYNCGEINVSLDPTSNILYNFTTCNQTGREGPTQTQCNTTYNGTTLSGINVTAGIQYWTVPTTGTYSIEAVGAGGGNGTVTYRGGRGARMVGTFTLTAGQVIKVLVGQKGGDLVSYNGGGGGGGSFVTYSNNTPLIIAGGGGGGGGNSNPAVGQNGLNGTMGGNGSQGVYTGGINGLGGGASAGSAGGAGLTGNGTASSCTGTKGIAFIYNGSGGSGGTCAAGGGAGGFGGGSGGEWCCQGATGAGGGYSGGAGTDSNGVAGGGASYNSGTNQTNVTGNNSGQGYVTITFITPSKSGLITTNTSATPFYTNTSNPYNVSLNSGQSQIITWWVNATGNINSTNTFFVYANQTSNMSINNQTANWNVTIIALDINAPIVYNNKTNLTKTTPFGETVYFNITVNETNPAQYIFSFYNGTDWVNDTAQSYISGREIEVNKTINSNPIVWIWYFNDTFGNRNQYTGSVALDAIVGINLISPLTDINITSKKIFNVTVNVSCNGQYNCRDINVSLETENAAVFDNFDTGALSGDYWTTYSSVPTHGRVIVSDIAPYSGTYSVLTDVLDGGGANLNELITNFDFTGSNNIIVSYMWKEAPDQDELNTGANHNNHHNSDGVYYTCNGTYWYLLVNASNNFTSWTNQTINVSAHPNFCTNNVTSSFKIKFTQYDDTQWPNDGIAWDDIRIQYGRQSAGVIQFNSSATPFYTNTSNPATITLDTGQSQIVTFWVNASGSGNETFKLFVNANRTISMNNSNQTVKINVTIRIPDNTTPTWTGNKTNITASTAIGTLVYFNITPTEEFPDKYIFSWYNGTYWINDSPQNYTSGQQIQVTKTIDTSPIYWTWYFNDTSGNLNQTTVWSTELNSAFTISRIYPTVNINATQDQFFNVTVLVNCTSATPCREINVSLDPISNLVTNGDFETGTMNGWTTAGNGNWTVQSTTKKEGTYAAKSGSIGHSQYTYIVQNITTTSASNITFSWYVSSEASCDYIGFCINQAYGTGTCTRGGGNVTAISGTGGGWQNINKALLVGTNQLLWYYAKDGSVVTGDDAGYIDNVTVMGTSTGKGGLITTNTSATPFWTNTTNPINISLLSGQTQEVTFWVNATGAGENTYEFFAYANKTSNPSINNVTSIWNVTIKDLTIPGVQYASQTVVNGTYSQNWISVNVTATDTRLSSIAINYYNGTRNLINSTTNTTSPNYKNLTNLTDGTYYFNATATDTASNTNYTETRMVVLDTTPPYTNYSSPTRLNNTQQPQTFMQINTSIIETSLSKIQYEWNSSTYAVYNDSLSLMFNFDNISTFGENNTYVVDVSNRSHRGTVNGPIMNRSAGKYNGAFTFDGVDDYINVTTLIEVNQTVAVWLKQAGIWTQYINASGTFYQNGVFVGGQIELPIHNKTGTVIIGQYYNNTYFNGSIDELRIWDMNISANDAYVMYISNLNKYNNNSWYFYANQSTNSTTGLFETNYTYNVYAYDNLSNINNSGLRKIVIDYTPPTFNNATNMTFEHYAGVNYTLNATDVNALWCYRVNDTTRFNVNCTGYIKNNTGLPVSVYGLNLSINDTAGNVNWTLVWINVTDTTPPAFWNITNLTQEYVVALGRNLNATDSNPLACFKVNDSNFRINCTGYLQNNTRLKLGMHHLNITVNDTYNNEQYALFWVNVTDTIAPSLSFDALTPTNNTKSPNTWFIVNVSLIEEDLYDLIYNFNTSNFTMYNDSLVLMMNFNNVSVLGENDTYTVDISKYQNNGTVIGSLWTSAGKYNGAFAFDGVNDYINLTNMTYMGSTISVWINNSGIWMHYVNASGNIYVNGLLSGNETSLPIHNNGGEVIIGQYPNASYYSGAIDEVRIWNRSLSAAEVYQQYVSNLNKYNTDRWALYVNQSKNATDVLNDRSYTYQLFARDLRLNLNRTDATRMIVVDTVAPAFTSIANQTVYEDDAIAYTINASDANGISCFRVNDTALFRINCTGYLQNNATPVVGTYWVNVTINDTASRETSELISITVIDKGRISVDLITPTTHMNASQNEVFTVTVNVSCRDNNCGLINVTLDPTSQPVSCKHILDTGLSTGSGNYSIYPFGNSTPLQVYCDMTTEGGGWTLFANMNSGYCAEGLTMGGNPLTSLSTIYATNKLGVFNHSQWMVTHYVGGVYTHLFVMTFNNTRNLSNRFATLVATGERVSWYGKNTTNQTIIGNITTFRFSSDSGITQANWYSRSTMSGDDGCWGVANVSTLDSGVAGPGLNGVSNPRYGFANDNTGDSSCDTYYMGYTSSSSTNWLGHVYIRENVTYVAAPKGTISTNSSATPFWTSSPNPTNVTLNINESSLVTWIVNATGTVGTNNQFFAYANRTNDLAVNNISALWNVTIIVNVGDVTAPTFTTIANQTFEYRYPWNYTVRANDTSGVSCYRVNDTTNFRINCTGFLTNNTVIATGVYNLNISVNDTYNNTRSQVIWVNVTATTLPAITGIVNQTISYGSAFTTNITATDTSGINCFKVNESTYFSINCTGYLQNKTLVPIGVYQINITANDTIGNENSEILRLNITSDDFVAPTLNITYPINGSTFNYTHSTISLNATTNENATCYYETNLAPTNYTMQANATRNGFNSTLAVNSNTNYTVYVYCRDDSYNWNNNGTVTFRINMTPSIGVYRVYPLTAINVSKYAMFNVTVNITCENEDCAEITVSLDPTSNLITNGDFETGTLSSWSTGGNANWSVQSTTKTEGTYAAKTGAAGHSQNTWITQNVTLTSAANLTFYWKVSSEGGWDYLGFCVNKTFGQTGCTRGTGNVSAISGTIDWTKKTVAFNPGTYTLLWYYAKDGSVAVGSDAGWIDNITMYMENTSLKSGLVSTNTSATPFWTNTTNPSVIALNKTQSTLVTFWINATGNLNNTFEFYVYANKTSYAISNESTKWNVTILDAIAPEISYNAPTTANGTHNLQKYIVVNVSASDASLDKVMIYLYNSTGLMYSNATTAINYTTLSYGVYYINATANDTSGNRNYTSTRIINLTQPTLVVSRVFPTTDLNVTKDRWFNVTVNVTCLQQDCGNVNVTLDPITTIECGDITNCDFSQSGDCSSSEGTCTNIPGWTYELITNGTNKRANVSTASNPFGSGNWLEFRTTYTGSSNTNWQAYIYSDIFSVSANYITYSFQGEDYDEWGYGLMMYEDGNETGNYQLLEYRCPFTGSWSSTDDVWGGCNDNTNYFPTIAINKTVAITSTLLNKNVRIKVWTGDGGTGDNGKANLDNICLSSASGICISSRKSIIPTTPGTIPFWTNISSNPYTVNLNKTNSTIITYYVNATGTQGNTYEFFAYATVLADTSLVTNSTLWNVTIIDQSVPEISFLTNTTTTGNHSQTYIAANVSASDDNLRNITVYLYNAAGIVNTTVLLSQEYLGLSEEEATPLYFTSETTSETFIEFTNLPNDNYYLNATAFDTSNNSASTETRQITLDTINPLITIIAPMDRYNTTQPQVNFTFIVNDNLTTNCTVYVDAAGAIEYTAANNNISIISGVNTTLLVSQLTNRTYQWYIGCIDGAGNTNTTATRTLTMDNQPPVITISSPIDNSSVGYTVYLNSEISEELTRLDSAWYALYNNSNASQTIKNGTLNSTDSWDTTWNTSIYPEVEWNITYSVFANDSLGNIRNVNRSFHLDNVNPVIQIIIPRTSGYYNANFSLNTAVQDSSLNYTYYNITKNGVIIESNSAAYNPVTTRHVWNNTVNVSGNTDGTYLLEVFAQDSTGRITRDSKTFYIDKIAPSLSITYPSDAVYLNVTAINFNWTSTDTVSATMACNLTVGAVVGSFTCLNATFCNYTVNSFSDAQYNYSIWCTDNATNSINETNTFTIDTTKPAIRFNRGTTETGNYSQNYVIANLTITEANVDTITVILYNGTNNQTINTTQTTNKQIYLNYTNLPEGRYYLNATVNDSKGYVNVTNTSNIFLDYVKPQGTIGVNDTTIEYGIESVAINWTVTENNPRTILFNITYPIGALLYESNEASGNIILTPENLVGLGTYRINVYTVDIAGNTNLTTRTFGVDDTIYPALTLINPLVGYVSQNWMLVNATSNDSSIVSVSLNIFNAAGSYTDSNATTYKHSNNFTSLADGTYYYNATGCDDTRCNSTVTKTIIVDTVNPVLTLESPTLTSGVVNDTCLVINASATDLYQNTIQVYLYNGTNDLINTSTQTSSSLFYNFTDLTDGTYYLNASAVDLAGNRGASKTETYSLNATAVDGDRDGVPDVIDKLLYNETYVNATGVSRLNITISGNTTTGTFSGIENVKIYDNATLMLNFTHNFSRTVLDLRKITIVRDTNSLIVNVTGQIQDGQNKTIYLTDNNFNALCVKDESVSSIENVTSTCTGANETDLTTCLGNSAGVTVNRIKCIDTGTTLEFSNLQHTAVRGTPTPSTPAPTTTTTTTAAAGGGSVPSRKVESIEEEKEKTKEEKEKITEEEITEKQKKIEEAVNAQYEEYAEEQKEKEEEIRIAEHISRLEIRNAIAIIFLIVLFAGIIVSAVYGYRRSIYIHDNVLYLEDAIRQRLHELLIRIRALKRKEIRAVEKAEETIVAEEAVVAQEYKEYTHEAVKETHHILAVINTKTTKVLTCITTYYYEKFLSYTIVVKTREYYAKTHEFMQQKYIQMKTIFYEQYFAKYVTEPATKYVAKTKESWKNAVEIAYIAILPVKAFIGQKYLKVLALYQNIKQKYYAEKEHAAEFIVQQEEHYVAFEEKAEEKVAEEYSTVAEHVVESKHALDEKVESYYAQILHFFKKMKTKYVALYKQVYKHVKRFLLKTYRVFYRAAKRMYKKIFRIYTKTLKLHHIFEKYATRFVVHNQYKANKEFRRWMYYYHRYVQIPFFRFIRQQKKAYTKTVKKIKYLTSVFESQITYIYNALVYPIEQQVKAYYNAYVNRYYIMFVEEYRKLRSNVYACVKAQKKQFHKVWTDYKNKVVAVYLKVVELYNFITQPIKTTFARYYASVVAWLHVLKLSLKKIKKQVCVFAHKQKLSVYGLQRKYKKILFEDYTKTATFVHKAEKECKHEEEEVLLYAHKEKNHILRLWRAFNAKGEYYYAKFRRKYLVLVAEYYAKAVKITHKVRSYYCYAKAYVLVYTHKLKLQYHHIKKYVLDYVHKLKNHFRRLWKALVVYVTSIYMKVKRRYHAMMIPVYAAVSRYYTKSLRALHKAEKECKHEKAEVIEYVHKEESHAYKVWKKIKAVVLHAYEETYAQMQKRYFAIMLPIRRIVKRYYASIRKFFNTVEREYKHEEKEVRHYAKREKNKIHDLWNVFKTQVTDAYATLLLYTQKIYYAIVHPVTNLFKNSCAKIVCVWHKLFMHYKKTKKIVLVYIAVQKTRTKEYWRQFNEKIKEAYHKGSFLISEICTPAQKSMQIYESKIIDSLKKLIVYSEKLWIHGVIYAKKVELHYYHLCMLWMLGFAHLWKKFKKITSKITNTVWKRLVSVITRATQKYYAFMSVFMKQFILCINTVKEKVYAKFKEEKHAYKIQKAKLIRAEKKEYAHVTEETVKEASVISKWVKEKINFYYEKAIGLLHVLKSKFFMITKQVSQYFSTQNEKTLVLWKEYKHKLLFMWKHSKENLATLKKNEQEKSKKVQVLVSAVFKKINSFVNRYKEKLALSLVKKAYYHVKIKATYVALNMYKTTKEQIYKTIQYIKQKIRALLSKISFAKIQMNVIRNKITEYVKKKLKKKEDKTEESFILDESNKP